MKDFILDIYVNLWHLFFRLRNPKWKNSTMYTNGQFDEIPYAQFDKLFPANKNTK